MSNILIYSAVPFSLGRIQSVGRTALRSCVDVSKQSGLGNDKQTGGKKKRMRLMHLTPEEKRLRRKIMAREASQKARDAVNDKMNVLEKKMQQLKRERDILLMENQNLKENHKELISENKKLLQVTYLGCNIESIGKHCENTSPQKMLNAGESAVTMPESLNIHEDRRSLGHAWFINTPLLKGQDLQQFFMLMAVIAVTELLRASFPPLTMGMLIRDLALTSLALTSNIGSGILHTVMNSVYLPLNYHKSWT